MQTLKFEFEKPERLDKFLSHEVGLFSRTQWQRAIKNGFVLVNNEVVRTNHKLNTGDEVKIMQEPQANVKTLPDVNIEIIYECPDYIIVNKPSGITIHPDNNYKDNTVIQQLIAKYPEIAELDPDSERPGIVHRLDKDVSGVMVIARTPAMLTYLQDQFKNRKIKKEYTALVHGHFTKTFGTIKANIERSEISGKMLVRPENQTGKESVTEYEVIEQFHHFALLKIIIKTGRTHQIRTIMQALNHPIVGDHIYNKKTTKAKIDISRLFLHASKLEFALLNGEKVQYKQDLPYNLQQILANMRPLNKKIGKIIIISGTTASGKTSVVEKYLENTNLPFARIITCTTRHKRPNEKNGKDYHFFTDEKFDQAIANDEFLEWAHVHKKRYGTPKKSVQEELAKGNNVILIIDVQGALNIKENNPEAILIFIKTENFDQIKERIISRENKIPDDLETRLESAKKELALANEYNYQIINKENKLDEAATELNEVINRELL